MPDDHDRQEPAPAARGGPVIAEILVWVWTIGYLSVLFVWVGGRPRTCKLLPVQPARWITETSAEVHPFMPFAFLANLAISTWGEPVGARVITFVVTTAGIVSWFLDEDDDGRWKRRRKKLGGKVRSLGHRLVVAPAGGR